MFFCDRIRGKVGQKPHQALDRKFTFSAFEFSKNVPKKDWDEVLQAKDIFLSLEYLSILEAINGGTFRGIYVVIYDNKVPFGIIYFQIIDFPAKTFGELLEDQIKSLNPGQTKLFEEYIKENENEVLMRLLTCGNNIVSGEHAFYFKEGITKEKAFHLVEKVIDLVGNKEKLSGKISAILAKDFYSPVAVNSKNCFFHNEKFVQFNVEPNMIIDIPEGVKNMTDYLGHFSKKYRNRAKNILKLGEALVIKELSLDEIENANEQIFSLYEQVYDKAKFKIVKLPKAYFLNCKKVFVDDFHINAFYLNNKMVAFSSGFFTPENFVEAHYIGFEYQINKEYELYQNILYRNIECAIQYKKSHVNLGRTASEIKSTVGAKAHELTCYIRPQNTISKLVLKPFIQFLQPAEWIPRNPFKEGEPVSLESRKDSM
jgi:hypothetical protein